MDQRTSSKIPIIMLEQAKALLKAGKTEQAISVLDQHLEFVNPRSDEAYFLMGNAYRKLENLSEAMNCYLKAVEFNPKSPAKEAYEQVSEILDFYFKDMYNQ